jgi:hypothetical protein
MRRWLVLVLLLLMLPFQLAWAAAAPYCAHETQSVVAKHFGHHEHRHQAGDQSVPAAEDSGDAAGAYHADCGSCNLSAGASLPTPGVEVALAPHDAVRGHHLPRYRSHTPSGPERPDIAELTPAARFGGGVVSGAFPLP